MDTQRIVCLGHSLLMDGIATSLASRPGLHLIRIDLDEDKLAKHVQSLKPDLVIYEVSTVRTECLLALLGDPPGMQLVGVHPEHSHLVVLNGHQQPYATMQDLVTLLENSPP